jgi:hypothetical protein
MKRVIASKLVFGLLLVGCGHIEEPIGETGGGSGGSKAGAGGSGTPAGASGSTPGGGYSSAGAPSGEECGAAICAAGSECFIGKGATSDDGVCVPLCNPEEQTDQSSWGLPCSDAIGGGDGTCRPFLRYGEWPGGMGSGLSGVGVCTHSCDPLAQDCPSGFSCDLTDTPDGSVAVWSFACLPHLTPQATGDACQGTPLGECAVGSTCSGDDYICRDFCDRSATNACPTAQSCVVPPWFPADSPVGICVN